MAPGIFAVLPEPGAAARAIIVWLDADRLRQQLLEPLVAKYFGTGDASEYLVSIVQRDEPSQVVYASATDPAVDERSADVSTGMFDLRMDEMTRLTDLVRGGPAPGVGERSPIASRSRSCAAPPAPLMRGGC